jgi:DNA-directed RNA polymerase subunit L
MLLLSKTFQDEDETFGNMLKEGIIKDITSTYEENKLYNVM